MSRRNTNIAIQIRIRLYIITMASILFMVLSINEARKENKNSPVSTNDRLFTHQAP